MADRSSESLFSHLARAVFHPLGEVVHVAAVYLGIAVLVTIVLGVTVPSLREQSRQMHEALLVSLRPAALQEDNLPPDYGLGGLAEIASLPIPEPRPLPEPKPLTEPVALAAPAPSVALDGGGKAAPGSAGAGITTAAEAAAAPSRRTFAQALRREDTLSIPGTTRGQVQALRSYIARKYKIAGNVAGVLVQTAFTVGKELKLDPQLLLAVIAIESRYNPFAESHVGAQGLMQVMTKVHQDKFARFGDVADAAINPIANIRVGAQILSDCVKRRGSVEGGLACYVGSTGPGDGGYGAKVLAERRRIALASGIPLS